MTAVLAMPADTNARPDCDEDERSWQEIVDELTRRHFFLAGAVATLTAGCSRPDTSDRSIEPASRSVVDARGTQQIPLEINRVVCVDGGGDLELAALCGYEVVGYYDRSTVGAPYPDSMQAVISDTAVRLEFEPNAETIAALSPDLILLDSSYWADELGNQLTGIAPVLVAARSMDPSPSDWRDDFTYFAQALGHSNEAQAVIAAYDDKLEQLRQDHAASIATTKINLFQILPDGSGGGLLPAPTGTLFGTIVQAVGGSFAAPQDSLVDRLDLVSETIDTLRGDVVVRTAFTLTPDAFAALDRNPLWQHLPAAAQGRVSDAAVLVTNFGGPALATACIDVVARAYALTE